MANMTTLVSLLVLTTGSHTSHPYQNIQGTDVQSYISSQNMPILRATSLSGFTKVISVHLKNCNIQEIEPDAFRTMESLVEVDLSNNLLYYLPEDLFEHNTQLEGVSLRNNKFTSVPYIAVPLKKLDLSRCKISTFNFTKTLDVKSLDLSHNNLEALSSQDMDILNKVTIINLNNNHWKCGSQFDAVLCWSLNRSNVSSERIPIKCSTRMGYFISYTTLHRQEFCEKHIENTDPPSSTAVITSDEIHPLELETSYLEILIIEASVTETSNKPISDQSTSGYSFPQTSDKPIWDKSTSETVDSVSKNTFAGNAKKLKSISDDVDSESRSSTQISNKPSSNELEIPKYIDLDSEKFIPENSNERKLDKLTISEEMDSNPRKFNPTRTESQESVTIWIIIAIIGWVLAAAAVALLAYTCMFIVVRTRYKRVNSAM